VTHFGPPDIPIEKKAAGRIAFPACELTFPHVKKGIIYRDAKRSSGSQFVYNVRLGTTRYTCLHTPNQQTLLLDAGGSVVCASHDRRKSWERWLGTPGNTIFVDADGTRRGELTLRAEAGQYRFQVDAVAEDILIRSHLLHTVYESDLLCINHRLAIWAGEPGAAFQFDSSLDEAVICGMVGHLVASADARGVTDTQRPASQAA
jgi:hypothetical protein